MKIITDAKKIEQLLTRGVDKIYPSREALAEILHSGKKLKLYQGFDPTSDKLHLGHMVGLRKHQQWQDMGHEVIFLVGDGTGEAGDPTGKKKTREKFFTTAELRENAKDYLQQASRIVRFDGPNPVKIMYNGDWLNKLTKTDILNIAQNFSVQQLLERDMFQERMKVGEEVNIREFLYPLLQAYDSVVLDVDLELGGSDQTFNMLAGRTLMKKTKGKEKFVMTTKLLEDNRGVKIGKTEGNSIALDDEPRDLYGKIMAFPDEVIAKCFEALTTLPMDEIPKENPLEAKKKLAFEIVKDLNSEEKAKSAQGFWEKTFQQKKIPEDIRKVKRESEDETLMATSVREGMVRSNSDFRRLIDSKAITDLDTGDSVDDANFTPKRGGRFKIGKHKFIEIDS